MTRFRYSGTNWEGRKWFLSAGGVVLGHQVEDRWPASHPTDGTVASKGHDANNPDSDHRPRPFGASPAVVRALDVGEVTEDDGIEFAEALRKSKDPRIKYVLHEDRIFSSYSTSTRDPWEWAHLHIGHPSHVHVSFTDLADTLNNPWNLEDTMLRPEVEQFVNDLYDRMKELYPNAEVPTAAGLSTYLIPDVRRNIVTMDELQDIVASSSNTDQVARKLAQANAAKLDRIKEAI